MNYQELDHLQLLKEYTSLVAKVNKPGSNVSEDFAKCAEELMSRLHRLPTNGKKEMLINALVKECGTRHNKAAKIRNVINKFL